MLVLHEGQIPFNYHHCSKSYKIGLLRGKEDIVYLDEIAYKGIKLLKYNEGSLRFIRKYIDTEETYEFLYNVVLCSDPSYSDFSLIAVFDNETMELLGASLVSKGRPWYAPKNLIVYNEECTVSFKKGVGLARILSFVFENVLAKENKDCKLIMFSNANLPNQKMLENTYERHLNYSTYKTFYKEVN